MIPPPRVMVAFTAYQRPHYLRETLASWREVRGVDSVELHVMLEPSEQRNTMLDVIAGSDLSITPHLNAERLGVLRNPWHALESVFSFGADLAILAEEDVVVADDVLEYFQGAYRRHSQDRRVLGICAYSERETGRDEATNLSTDFAVLLWGTWRRPWHDAIRDAWDFDYSTFDERPGHHSGWDWELSRLARRTDQLWAHPEVSRSKHIGEHGGTHTTPETHAALRCPTFRRHRERLTWSTNQLGY